MEKETFWHQMNDTKNVYIQKWYAPKQTPKAIMQISHGMVEHIDRYDLFATFLVNNGVFVYGNDHRGHGKTGEDHGTMGYFDNEQGFEKTSEDLAEITTLIKKDFPHAHIFLFGHSMGSFLVRRYIQKYSSSLGGVILSGTGNQPNLVTKIGKLVAKHEIRKKGRTEPSILLNKLAFGTFNKKIKNAETEFDWLSRDKQQVKKYIEDPHTGFVPTAAFFYDLFDGLSLIRDDKQVTKIRKELPILFISGDHDPVGKETVGVKQVISQYHKHGIKPIDSIFYKDGRHEILNEINKEEVFHDILAWMERTLP